MTLNPHKVLHSLVSRADYSSETIVAPRMPCSWGRYVRSWPYLLVSEALSLCSYDSRTHTVQTARGFSAPRTVRPSPANAASSYPVGCVFSSHAIYWPCGFAQPAQSYDQSLCTSAVSCYCSSLDCLSPGKPHDPHYCRCLTLARLAASLSHGLCYYDCMCSRLDD